jgi:hypothetical protein
MQDVFALMTALMTKEAVGLSNVWFERIIINPELD